MYYLLSVPVTAPANLGGFAVVAAPASDVSNNVHPSGCKDNKVNRTKTFPPFEYLYSVTPTMFKSILLVIFLVSLFSRREIRKLTC